MRAPAMYAGYSILFAVVGIPGALTVSSLDKLLNSARSGRSSTAELSYNRPGWGRNPAATKLCESPRRDRTACCNCCGRQKAALEQRPDHDDHGDQDAIRRPNLAQPKGELPANKTKECQINPSKKAWISLDSFGQYGAFQRVATNPNKKIFPRLNSRLRLCAEVLNVF
jgi:hypothetical protein